MFRTFVLLIAALGCINPCAASSVTDNFSGAGTLFSPGNLGPANSFEYLATVQDFGPNVMISYDIKITSVSGTVDGSSTSGLHFDSRGFGDTGGVNDSLQSTPVGESFVLTIENYTATPLAGGTIVSDTMVIQFESFDLVNNGNSASAVAWNDNSGGTGITAAASGGSGVTTTEINLAAGATQLNLTADTAFMWINNVSTSHVGSVTSSTVAVPEPTSGMIWVTLSLVAIQYRRRV